MKVMTVVGTRPEVIRLSRVIAQLDSSMDQVLVHTGQNTSHQLNHVFFDELGIRPPDHFLNINNRSLGTCLGDLMPRIEALIQQEAPDAYLVLGDTNSAISSLIAKRMHVPVFHMEAGNRSFDENVPEETNRRVIDHLSDFHLVYSEHARRNLLSEGISPRRILHTGSPMTEVLDFYSSGIEQSNVLDGLELEAGQYFLVSVHRQENVDSHNRLDAVLKVLEVIADTYRLPILVSLHPRTRLRLQERGIDSVDGVMFHEPFGFLDYCHLQTQAKCVVSDSGTIAEEASILKFPAVTLRSSIERPEALDSGTVIMTDLDADRVIAGISAAQSSLHLTSRPSDYLSTNCSIKVRNFILSAAMEHRVWAGIR